MLVIKDILKQATNVADKFGADVSNFSHYGTGYQFNILFPDRLKRDLVRINVVEDCFTVFCSRIQVREYCFFLQTMLNKLQ